MSADLIGHLLVCGLELFCTFSKVFVVDFSSGKNWNLTKVFVPVEVKFHQPSYVGLPLKFSLESVLFLRVNTTVKAEVQPKFFIPLPDQVTVNGKMNIRFVIVYSQSSIIITKGAEPLFPYYGSLLRRSSLGVGGVNSGGGGGGARSLGDNGKRERAGASPLFSLSPSRRSPGASVIPSPQPPNHQPGTKEASAE